MVMVPRKGNKPMHEPGRLLLLDTMLVLHPRVCQAKFPTHIPDLLPAPLAVLPVHRQRMRVLDDDRQPNVKGVGHTRGTCDRQQGTPPAVRGVIQHMAGATTLVTCIETGTQDRKTTLMYEGVVQTSHLVSQCTKGEADAIPPSSINRRRFKPHAV
jgi:hypothetical protein